MPAAVLSPAAAQNETTLPALREGTGKFFLVKGQRPLEPVSSELKESRNVFIQDDSGMTREVEELVPPYLLTDADGKALYGYGQKTGEIARFDGKQFNTIQNSGLIKAMRGHLQQNGVDVYTAYNGYTIQFLQTDVPAGEKGVVYVLAQAFPKEEPPDDEDDGDAPSDDGDDPSDDDGDVPSDDGDAPSDDDGDDPSDDDGGEFPPEEGDQSWYLGAFDLNDADPHWRFNNIEALPAGIDIANYTNTLNLAVCNGKLYAVCAETGADIETLTDLSVFSFDLTSKKWAQEAKLPYLAASYDLVASNGKLYAMFGCLPDTSLPTQERLLRSVYCFNGKSWEKKSDQALLSRAINNHGTLVRREAVTSVKNGLLFVGASADVGGNVFLYHTQTDQLEPLYYTTSDSLSDTYGAYASCVVTRYGVYYIRQIKDDYQQGWALSLLPESSGAYESPFADVIIGDTDGDGKITIADVTLLQKYLAEFDMPENFQLEACDTNGDGKIDIADVTHLQMYLAEFDVTLG